MTCTGITQVKEYFGSSNMKKNINIKCKLNFDICQYRMKYVIKLCV